MEISTLLTRRPFFSIDRIYVKSHIVTISVKLIGILSAISEEFQSLP